jgi:hypothetical protein
MEKAYVALFTLKYIILRTKIKYFGIILRRGKDIRARKGGNSE